MGNRARPVIRSFSQGKNDCNGKRTQNSNVELTNNWECLFPCMKKKIEKLEDTPHNETAKWKHLLSQDTFGYSPCTKYIWYPAKLFISMAAFHHLMLTVNLPILRDNVCGTRRAPKSWPLPFSRFGCRYFRAGQTIFSRKLIVCTGSSRSPEIDIWSSILIDRKS